MEQDIRITQLLCSRLCHDLVGPVSALNNGVELIESAPDMLDDSLALLGTSAVQASRRLAFYRVAFGFGGGDGTESLRDVRRLALDFLAEGNVTLDWPEIDGGMPVPGKDGAKLLMNMILIGADTLPRGGGLQVHVGAIDGGLGLAVRTQGHGAALKDAMREAMAPDCSVEDLTAQTVQAHFTTRLAQAAGAEIETTQDGDAFQFAAVVPLP